jgi:hypothetical protein
MKSRISLLVILLLAGCVAKQEESASKQAEAYIGQLGKRIPPGTPIKAAIAQLEADGFSCREAAARPMAMGHTLVCGQSTQQAWGVALLADNDGRLTAVRSFERTAAQR